MLGSLSEKMTAFCLAMMASIQICTLKTWTRILRKHFFRKSSPLLEKLLAWLLQRMTMGYPRALHSLTTIIQMMLERRWKQ